MSEPQKPELTAVPDPEVADRPHRRRFTAAYKLSVLRDLDACTEPGRAGEVLHEYQAGAYHPPIDWCTFRANLEGFTLLDKDKE